MPSPTISVIIPVYNSERFLRDCLTSVQQQTFQDIEIICVNDGSTDGSADILHTAAENDERIQFVTQVNQGLTKAREQGVLNSQGDYVYFLDSDDLIHQQTLEILVNIAKSGSNKSIDIVCHRHKNVSENTDISVTSLPLKLKRAQQVIADKGILSKKISIFSWGKLYKRSLFEGFTFPAMAFAEDLYCTPILCMKASTIYVTDEKLCFYRQHGNSLTGTLTEAKVNAVFDNGIRMLNEIEINKHSTSSIKLLRKYFVHYQLYSIATVLINNDKLTNLHDTFINRWLTQNQVSLTDLGGLKRLVLSNFIKRDIKKAKSWFAIYKKIKF